MGMVKTMMRSAYRGLLFIMFLSFMLLITALLLAFLANPPLMFESVQQAFRML